MPKRIYVGRKKEDEYGDERQGTQPRPDIPGYQAPGVLSRLFTTILRLIILGGVAGATLFVAARAGLINVPDVDEWVPDIDTWFGNPEEEARLTAGKVPVELVAVTFFEETGQMMVSLDTPLAVPTGNFQAILQTKNQASLEFGCQVLDQYPNRLYCLGDKVAPFTDVELIVVQEGVGLSTPQLLRQSGLLSQLSQGIWGVDGVAFDNPIVGFQEPLVGIWGVDGIARDEPSLGIWDPLDPIYDAGQLPIMDTPPQIFLDFNPSSGIWGVDGIAGTQPLVSHITMTFAEVENCLGSFENESLSQVQIRTQWDALAAVGFVMAYRSQSGADLSTPCQHSIALATDYLQFDDAYTLDGNYTTLKAQVVLASACAQTPELCAQMNNAFPPIAEYDGGEVISDLLCIYDPLACGSPGEAGQVVERYTPLQEATADLRSCAVIFGIDPEINNYADLISAHKQMHTAAMEAGTVKGPCSTFQFNSSTLSPFLGGCNAIVIGADGLMNGCDDAGGSQESEADGSETGILELAHLCAASAGLNAVEDSTDAVAIFQEVLAYTEGGGDLNQLCLDYALEFQDAHACAGELGWEGNMSDSNQLRDLVTTIHDAQGAGELPASCQSYLDRHDARFSGLGGSMFGSGISDKPPLPACGDVTRIEGGCLDDFEVEEGVANNLIEILGESCAASFGWLDTPHSNADYARLIDLITSWMPFFPPGTMPSSCMALLDLLSATVEGVPQMIDEVMQAHSSPTGTDRAWSQSISFIVPGLTATATLEPGEVRVAGPNDLPADVQEAPGPTSCPEGWLLDSNSGRCIIVN